MSSDRFIGFMSFVYRSLGSCIMQMMLNLFTSLYGMTKGLGKSSLSQRILILHSLKRLLASELGQTRALGVLEMLGELGSPGSLGSPKLHLPLYGLLLSQVLNFPLFASCWVRRFRSILWARG